MNYRALHAVAEEKLLEMLRQRGHVAFREYRTKNCIFDVYDETENTCWEVLTVKFVRSSHEKDEAILAKIFCYTMVVPRIKFLLVSYDHEELEMFHKVGIEHWHVHNGWMGFGGLGKIYYHRGQTAHRIAHKIYDAMKAYAPIREWTRPRRRKAHSEVAKVQKINDRLGLPHNFLTAIWRDYRVMWAWRLERILSKWETDHKCE
jgi:hypothetical protein